VRRRGVRRSVAAGLAAVVVFAVTARPAHAQSLARVSVDSVSAIDLFRGDGTTGRPDASVDISSVIRIGGGWSAHLRPWFFKSAADGSTWSRELYQAALRYEHHGAVSLRVDAGYIASPLGLGMLDMRADMNPTIQPHLSYFVPLLPFDTGAPMVGAITASYPLGATATVSTTRWDARAALVNSAPTRRSAFNAARGNPDPTPVLIAGGGVTPRPGLRLGAAFARGQYATAREVAEPAGSRRDLQMWTVEGEYAFGYTKLAGEWTTERFARGATRDTASTWFAQVAQTLTPRWFAAARHEAISAPPLAVAGAGAPRLSFRTSEGTAGYRLTPELTLRASVTLSRWYTARTSDRKAGVQVVWSRRWW
jgi:hypothetical protein